MVEAFSFVERGLVKCVIHVEPFSNVGKVFEDLRKGLINGRVVVQM